MIRHVPVMLHEVLELLDVHSQKNYIDCTLGGGGYTHAILERSGPDGKVLAIDADAHTIQRTSVRLAAYGSRFIPCEGNFQQAASVARSHRFCPISGVVWDLGLSTDLIMSSGRGFSFTLDEPLDMRFSPSHGQTAADLLATLDESDLADIFYAYGQERWSRRIARSIVASRTTQPITRTAELVDVIRRAVPLNYRHGRIHCATRTFQALRIAVNDELTALEESLIGMQSCIERGGTMVVVSFHSLEDRIVKTIFKQWHREGSAFVLTKKPVRPSREEQKINPASRSAKLRAIRIT